MLLPEVGDSFNGKGFCYTNSTRIHEDNIIRYTGALGVSSERKLERNGKSQTNSHQVGHPSWPL